MELIIIVALFSTIAGWFVLQSDVELSKVFDRNNDDMHWIAAAAMTTLILFLLGLITTACIMY